MSTTTTERITFNIAKNDGEATSISVFIGSDPLVATNKHPNFENICDYFVKSTPAELDPKKIRELFDVGVAIKAKFDRLSERVMVRNGRLFFDGDPMNDALAATIVKFNAEGNDDFRPLVNFMEKVMQNPNEHSRQHLYRWMTKWRFGITADGDIIAYKGVHRNGSSTDGDVYMSSSSGKAIVNGEPISGQIPNRPGTIIEMPRSEVRFDPRQGCSTGLHAGNWSYAHDFASVTLRVLINPRDVVSVPTDSSDQKMRICRYKVLDRVTSEDTNVLYVDDKLINRTRVAEAKPAKTTAKVAKKAPAPAAKKAKAAAAKKVAPVKAGPVKAAVKKVAQKAATTVKKTAAPKVAVTKSTESLPRFYEEFKAVHFDKLGVKKLQWLAREWGLNAKQGKDDLVSTLTTEAARRKRSKKIGVVTQVTD